MKLLNLKFVPSCEIVIHGTKFYICTWRLHIKWKQELMFLDNRVSGYDAFNRIFILYIIN